MKERVALCQHTNELVVPGSWPRLTIAVAARINLFRPRANESDVRMIFEVRNLKLQAVRCRDIVGVQPCRKGGSRLGQTTIERRNKSPWFLTHDTNPRISCHVFREQLRRGID